MHTQGRTWRTILWVEAITPLLAEMLAHELSRLRLRVEEAKEYPHPAALSRSADPARRCYDLLFCLLKTLLMPSKAILPFVGINVRSRFN